MVNIKLPDTFNEVDFKKDYLNNVKACDLMTKYNMSETQVYSYISRNSLKQKKESLNKKIEAKIESTITDRISKITDKVINKLEYIIDNSDNDNNILKACDSILNISGLKKQTLDNNVKNFKETPDIPTEFIMLRNKKDNSN